MGAAFDAHAKPSTGPLLALTLHVAVSGGRQILKAEQQTTSLLQAPLLLCFPLKNRTGHGDKQEKMSLTLCNESAAHNEIRADTELTSRHTRIVTHVINGRNKKTFVFVLKIKFDFFFRLLTSFTKKIF